MSAATTLLDSALKQARADWLAGDPSAWSRYTECVAQLEAHFRAPKPAARPARPIRLRSNRLRAQA